MMRKTMTNYPYLFLITLICVSCNKVGEKDPDKSTLKIALVDSLAVQLDDQTRRLPENIRNLCDVLTADSKECKRAYVLEPTLIRLDLNQEFSLKTNIEKGGTKDVNNPKVIGKLIKKNFDELEIPKSFTTKSSSNVNDSKTIAEFTATKAARDSILIFNEDGLVSSYTIRGKNYPVFSDINEVRNQMVAILCQNDKANFTLLINPPSMKPFEESTIPNPDSTKNSLSVDVTPSPPANQTPTPVKNKVSKPSIGKTIPPPTSKTPPPSANQASASAKDKKPSIGKIITSTVPSSKSSKSKSALDDAVEGDPVKIKPGELDSKTATDSKEN
jgi:hypothetical protein